MKPADHEVEAWATCDRRLAPCRSLRTSDRRKVPALHLQQGGKCYWCGAKVVIARKVEKAERRSLNHEKLTLVNGTEVLVATLDHLDGVLFRRSKLRLVVACYPCNSARARAERLFARFLLDRCQTLGRQVPKRVQPLIKVRPESGQRG